MIVCLFRGIESQKAYLQRVEPVRYVTSLNSVQRLNYMVDDFIVLFILIYISQQISISFSKLKSSGF